MADEYAKSYLFLMKLDTRGFCEATDCESEYKMQKLKRADQKTKEICFG